MKYILILFIVFISTLAFCQNEDSLMVKANQHYTAEEFQFAISEYEQILTNGFESADLYFNLGNAYFKTNDINNSILNYERALLLSPNDDDILFNLRIANQFIITSIEELPKPFFVRWGLSLTNLLPADSWAHASLVSFVLFLLLIGVFFFSRSVGFKRFSFFAGIIFITITIITFTFASKQKARIKNRNQAIVFCPRVTVKSSPVETGTDLFLIYEGLKVEITDSLNNWKEVKLLDGNQGWLQDSCIVKI